MTYFVINYFLHGGQPWEGPEGVENVPGAVGDEQHGGRPGKLRNAMICRPEMQRFQKFKLTCISRRTDRR